MTGSPEAEQLGVTTDSKHPERRTLHVNLGNGKDMMVLEVIRNISWTPRQIAGISFMGIGVITARGLDIEPTEYGVYGVFHPAGKGNDCHVPDFPSEPTVFIESN